MNLQETVLFNYKEVTGNQTFSAISKDTGLNISRLFRIFNGAKMKLDEYETFRTRANSNGASLNGLVEKLVILMDEDEAKGLKTQLERRLKKWQMGV